MEFEDIINKAVKADRQKRLAKSDQLTLGEMILKLDPIIEKQKDRINEKLDEAIVYYDFSYFYPTNANSWRGSYAELALNYKSDGEPLTVTKFTEMLKECVGKTFIGYKGGEFEMSRQTPVWVAEYGESGSTAVIDIIDIGYMVIIATGYREY